MPILVRDANNDIQQVETPPVVGRAAAAASRPVALSNEDQATLAALLGALTTLTSLTPRGVALVSVTTTAKTLAQLLTAAGMLSSAIPAGSKLVYMQPRGGDIRFADDGQAPTVGAAGLGADVYDRQAWTYSGDLSGLKLISESVTGFKCSLLFY